MPQVQFVDSSPGEPRGIDQFFANLQQAAVNRADRMELEPLLREYQQNINDENAYEKLQLGLMRSNVSPSKRLQTQQQLNQMQQSILNNRKALNEQAKAKQQTIQKEQNTERLRRAGATEDQIELYNAASVGGETKVMQDILEDISRKKTPPEIEGRDLTDFDQGLTPKERVARQESRFKLQTPLIAKNSESLNASIAEGDSLKYLQSLDASGKVGQGISNLNINPFTGSLILPKAATAEEQAFVKTINDFTVKAKDSFGARVTNFELDRFMQRLPTLANSPAGRKLIIRQMQIINEINQMERKALQEVFDQYGVRNIDYADAERIARDRIENKKEALRNEYTTLENTANQNEAEMTDHIKSNLKEGYVAMRKPGGQIKQFPERNVKNLEDKGYKRL